jgi:mannose-6-phosphate isomerase-like protein (cupin superfamily)
MAFKPVLYDYTRVKTIPKALIQSFEVYYVIEGNGFIKINGKDHSIKQGTSILVPAKTEHKFHGNKQDLVIFYVLGGR